MGRRIPQKSSQRDLGGKRPPNSDISINEVSRGTSRTKHRGVWEGQQGATEDRKVEPELLKFRIRAKEYESAQTTLGERVAKQGGAKKTEHRQRK